MSIKASDFSPYYLTLGAWLRKPWESGWREAAFIDAENLTVWEVARPFAPYARKIVEVVDASDVSSSFMLETVVLFRTLLAFRSSRGKLAVYMAPDDQAARCELALFLHCVPLLDFIETRVIDWS